MREFVAILYYICYNSNALAKPDLKFKEI